jgi:hypothetical protein
MYVESEVERLRKGVRSRVAPAREGRMKTELTSVKPDGAVHENGGMVTPRGRKEANSRPAL